MAINNQKGGYMSKSMATILAETLVRGFENEVQGEDIPESEKVPNFLTIIDDAVFEHRSCFQVSLETAKIMICTEIINICDNYDIRKMALATCYRLTDEMTKNRV
jgi:hypothetical protein